MEETWNKLDPALVMCTMKFFLGYVMGSSLWVRCIPVYISSLTLVLCASLWVSEWLSFMSVFAYILDCSPIGRYMTGTVRSTCSWKWNLSLGGVSVILDWPIISVVPDLFSLTILQSTNHISEDHNLDSLVVVSVLQWYLSREWSHQ